MTEQAKEQKHHSALIREYASVVVSAVALAKTSKSCRHSPVRTRARETLTHSCSNWHSNIITRGRDVEYLPNPGHRQTFHRH